MKTIVFFALFSMAMAIPHALPIPQDAGYGKHPAMREYDIEKNVARQVIEGAPRGSRLIDFRSNGVLTTEVIEDRLISNWTTIIDEVNGGFNCDTKPYGYYADPNNNCQIFHVCVNFDTIYPEWPEVHGTRFSFSFICPPFTIFDQVTLTCSWMQEATPCELAVELYNHRNQDFFKITTEEPTTENARQRF